MFEDIVSTLREEFSGALDVEQLTRVLVRLVVAGVLGGILGYEREFHGKDAGLRTHILVSMGAALFVLAPDQLGMHIADMSRVIQGIVTGIGFLGAGAILKHNDRREIEGLTTAAAVWTTAAIGIACGLGALFLAIASSLVALLVLAALPRAVRPKRDDKAS
ncbi:MAG: MgtC/SapB family protein [Planctomycetaceae bacterium]|nr:MgtC/SapB family protein [Planctomycetaceae bacterium]